MSFDRMVRAVDEWAGLRGRRDVFAQIGPTEWKPRHVEWARFLEPREFVGRVEEAELIVAHAGMGSIITAMTTGKPILVMPRRGDFRETRNDHQVATARRFREMGRVAVAEDEREMADRLDHLEEIKAVGRVGPWASPGLVEKIRGFIGEGRRL